MRRPVLVSWLLGILLAGAAHAQQRDKDDEAPAPTGKALEASDEDEAERTQPSSAIVVTARRLDAARTRIEEGLGATVYSLDNETIENRPGGETGSISAILTQAPGTGLSGHSLTIRGSRAIQVRINDVILPEALSDPADRLSSRLAETTRLITGTLPAQFGFAAGGVISVTTKNGLYQRGGQAELFGGSRGMLEPAIEWAGSAAGTSLFASGSLERSRSRVADALGRSAQDRRHEAEGLVFADHVLGPNDRMSLILGGSRERHRIGATALPAGVEQSSDAYGVGVFQHSAGPLSVQAALSVAGATNRARFVDADGEHRGSRGAQVDAAYQLGQAHRIGAGLLLTNVSVRETGRSERRRTSFGLYAQDEWNIAAGLTLNPGVRGDWLRGVGSGARIEPRVSLVWQSPHGFSAHVGYARYAAAAPLEEERGAQLPTKRDAQLPTERDDYADAGVQQKAGPWTFGIDGYWRSVHDFIAEREISGTATPSAFAFARARLRGIELSATYAKGPVTGWANIALSQSKARRIVAGEDLFSSGAIAASDRWLPLASDRPVTASAGVTWRLGKLSFGADVLASSGAVRTQSAGNPNGARAPAFATVGAAAVYHTRLAGKPADFRVDLSNLTDVRYVTSDAANLEGGWTRFGDGRAILIGIEQGF